MAMKRLAAFVLWIAVGGFGAGCCKFEDRPFEERFQPEETSLGPVDAKTQDAGTNDAGEQPIVAPAVDRDHDGVRRCCAAIAANAKAAPPQQQTTWTAALAECTKVTTEGAGRTGLDKVRKMLVDVGYPAACQ